MNAPWPFGTQTVDNMSLNGTEWLDGIFADTEFWWEEAINNALPQHTQGHHTSTLLPPVEGQPSSESLFPAPSAFVPFPYPPETTFGTGLAPDMSAFEAQMFTSTLTANPFLPDYLSPLMLSQPVLGPTEALGSPLSSSSTLCEPSHPPSPCPPVESTLAPSKPSRKRQRSTSVSSESASKRACTNTRKAVVIQEPDDDCVRPVRSCRTRPGTYREDADHDDNDMSDDDEYSTAGSDRARSPGGKTQTDPLAKTLYHCEDPKCNKSFTRRFDAERHFELKHKPANAQSRFACEYCGSVLSRKDGLRRHLRKSHAGLTHAQQESFIQKAVKTKSTTKKSRGALSL